MQGHKMCIFIAAIIAISLQTTLAFDCTQTGSESLACPENTTKCYSKRAADGSVLRGCVTDETCVAPACLTCATSNCNGPLMCRQCDGSQPECATTNATADAYNAQCSSKQQCRSVLNANGTVARGCGDPCNDDNCKSCTTDNCNVGIFPEDRRLCYQCSGADCNTVTAANLNPCALYKPNDQKCYTIGTDDKTMQRGCTSDEGAKCPATTTDANCALCDNENGCNNKAYSSVLGACITCNDNSACVGPQQADKAVNCAASVYTQTQNSCYKMVHANGTVQRGCSNALTGQECTANNNCTECKGNACNTDLEPFSCLVCRSDNYAPCRQAAVGPTTCKNTTPAQCFSGEWDGVVVRGCVGDMDSLMKYQCVNNKNIRCVITDGANTNKEVEKYNGAGSLQHMGLGLLGLIFLIRNAFNQF